MIDGLGKGQVFSAAAWYGEHPLETAVGLQHGGDMLTGDPHVTEVGFGGRGEGEVGSMAQRADVANSGGQELGAGSLRTTEPGRTPAVKAFDAAGTDCRSSTIARVGV